MIDLKALLQEQANKFTEAVTQYDTDIAAAKDEGKAEGIEIGKGQIQLPDANNPDAIYTQEQMNQAVNDGVANATAPLQKSVDDLTKSVEDGKSEVAAVKADLEKAQADMAAQAADAEKIKAEAIATFKSDLLAQYEAQQVAESNEETGFAQLLK